ARSLAAACRAGRDLGDGDPWHALAPVPLQRRHRADPAALPRLRLGRRRAAAEYLDRRCADARDHGGGRRSALYRRRRLLSVALAAVQPPALAPVLAWRQPRACRRDLVLAA